ncbi:dihydrofolate reductase family protein [Microbacterium sp. MYb62]|uniref:dihydrofolate reductase family protein n=1 Tax=Microbacterium sp. MYb62 TaxID=1848690 RepID=UPI000CFD6E27|nr:dihydrofolate reductase family protein [Microbacterium sp. MYb62]PRB14121.1 deaminase [Microbacterium sp. MYb62]
MGRIVVVNFSSIDGVIQSPLSSDEDRDDGFAHGGWVPPRSDHVVDGFMQDATVRAAGMLLGRRSYEILRDAWAGADDSVPAIAAMNRMPKYVVTSSPLESPWQNSHAIDGGLPYAVVDLAARTDGDLVVFGAGTLVRGLAAQDLVDEYRILIFPLVLGAGKRMFDQESRAASFVLSESVVSPGGVVILTYTREREV